MDFSNITTLIILIIYSSNHVSNHSKSTSESLAEGQNKESEHVELPCPDKVNELRRTVGFLDAG